MREVILSAENLAVKRGKSLILRNVSFQVHKQSIYGIIGSSGSGKSTLIKTILGLIEPIKGKVKFCNKPGTIRLYERKIGYSSQENAFYPKLTVKENMELFAEIYDVPQKIVKNRIDGILNIFDILQAKELPAEVLSGGMKRRLDLAISIIHDPEILVLDEPTNGLDINLQVDLWNYILKLNKMGKTIIISTHNLSDVEKYCSDYGMIFKKHFFGKTIIDKKKHHSGITDLESLMYYIYKSEKR